MKKERKEDSFIKQPYFNGGEKAMKDFVNTHLVYPELARINNIEGDVSIRYEINHKGDVTDVKVIGGLDEVCNEEAMRVVKLLKFIVPKTPRGFKVTFHKNIRIHFRLNQIKPAQIAPIQITESAPSVGPNMQINYTIILKPTKPVDKKSPQLVSYQYIVKM